METGDSTHPRRRTMGMSYKFQRLREKIRQAVESGELSGKLPGERELARRFHVNAKTLSKALTDLAAEGLLARSIGRGTFVRGSSAADAAADGPWLLVTDQDVEPAIVHHLRSLNPQAQVTADLALLRPSFLSQFAAVVDLAGNTPEPFVRDLLVRNIPVVTVGREPRTYSTSAVLVDRASALPTSPEIFSSAVTAASSPSKDATRPSSPKPSAVSLPLTAPTSPSIHAIRATSSSPSKTAPPPASVIHSPARAKP